MKRKNLNLILILVLLASILFACFVSVSAAETYDWKESPRDLSTDGALGTINVYSYGGEGYIAFKDDQEFEDILKNGFPANVIKHPAIDVTITLFGDATVSDFTFDDGRPCGIILKLNGHTLTVTGNQSHSFEKIIIEGNGGTIDFSNVNHGGTIFTLKEMISDSTGANFELSDLTIQNISAKQLFRINNLNSWDFFTSWKVSNITIKDGTFSGSGGAFFIDQTSTFNDISFDHCNFINLSTSVKNAGGTGGAALDIYNMPSSSSSNLSRVILSSCLFSNCTSNSNAGAIFVDDSYIYLGTDDPNAKTTFTNCTAGRYGGAIRDDNGKCTFENLVFIENTAKGSDWGGGAVLIDEDGSTYKNCEFYRNSADKGGAVTIDADDTSFIDCIFEGNSASKGKDIYVDDGNKQKAATGCTFYGYDSNSLYNGNFVKADSNSLIEDENLASTFSGGRVWLIIAIAVLVIGGVAVYLCLKKKNNR